MSVVTVSQPVVSQAFPAGTVDPGFTFTFTGTLADGTSFSAVQTNTVNEVARIMQPGSYSVVVSKLGVSGLGASFTVEGAPATVTISVPDAAAAPTVTQA